FHYEAAAAPLKLAREIRAQGAKASIAVRPTTSIEPILDHLSEFDMVLIMTVEPGFGGQSFIDTTLPKIRHLRQTNTEACLDGWGQDDGGVARTTIERAAEAGANVFVAGSAVFKADDADAEIQALRELAGTHSHSA